MQTAGLVALGAVVGVLSALLGIGGGIVLVPALVLLFGLTQTEAQGTSLATIPFGAIVAAAFYFQSVPLRLPVVAAVTVGVVAGAAVGARLIPDVPEAALRTGFGVLLLYLGVLFVFDLRPSHPVAVALVPVVAVAGWAGRRFRRPPPPTPPAEGQEYYI